MDQRLLTRADTPALVALWSRIFGPDFPIDEAIWMYCTWGTPGFESGDAVVLWENDAAVGFAVAKPWRLRPIGRMDSSVGFISALGVDPASANLSTLNGTFSGHANLFGVSMQYRF